MRHARTGSAHIPVPLAQRQVVAHELPPLCRFASSKRRAAPRLGLVTLMKKTKASISSDTHEASLASLESPHPTLWASLAFALATLTLAWPGLTGQILFNPRSDQYTNGYGFR